MPTGDQQDCSLLAKYNLRPLEGLYYIPDYVTLDEQDRLLNSLCASKARWTQVSGRRLQSYGGTVHGKWGGLLQATLPSWLGGLLAKIDTNVGVFEGAANHVLLNAYEPGEGILAHEDGPVYHPAACILTLGASAMMHFTRKTSDGSRGKREASVFLQPGSLLVFNNEAYKSCLHGIDQVLEDVMDDSVCNLQQCQQVAGAVVPRTATRYSLTIRRVLKVKRLVRLPGHR